MAVEAIAAQPVTISYQTLRSNPLALTKEIAKAFGSDDDCLGLIIVDDLPPTYKELRESLLLQAFAFAALDDQVKEKCVHAKSRYSFGWSHGKEIMNGQPDTLKGSYYANPIVDQPSVSAELKANYPEYYSGNVWPDSREIGLEAAFKELGSFIFEVGIRLATACQPFASELLDDKTLSLPDMISTSQTVKGRLLHYFPADTNTSSEEMDAAIDSWCGFHLDHSLLTGLCSAMYLQTDEKGKVKEVPPIPLAGLYIKTRGGTLAKAAIPANTLAFQTGEALQLATGGRLRATPHCVRVGSSTQAANAISRETFALFMQPDVDVQIKSGMTFGQFSKGVFDEHYAETM